MKLRASLLLAIAFCCGQHISHAQDSSRYHLVPIPVSLQPMQGHFSVPKELKVFCPVSEENAVKAIFQRVPNTRLVFVKDEKNASVSVQLLSKENPTIGNEGYSLSVNGTRVVITANKTAGLFYGLQTLGQVIADVKPVGGAVSIPAVAITDYPRFAWRGLMLDVSRHFFTKEEVKKYIDQMSKYKFNLFHWHLTDDEGWRIEIKSLPKLTEVGAWNVKKIGYFGTFSPIVDTDQYNYGGFYTQDDIKEVIQYAKERHVDILPEIDVPGHSMAAVASYPELSGTPGADKYKVRSGEIDFLDWTDSGIVAHVDNTLSPANPKVYTFLDKVFSEVAALFPFPYIHIGGDECPKTFWKTNPDILALMKSENIKDFEEVQSYFEKKVEKIVASKGKKVIGWDEILEGGLAPNAAVMSWRGEKGGIEASKLKHDVIMSPTTYAYLDYMQGDAAIEPRVYATLRLKKAYEYDPVPEGADPRYIKGGQANLWSEQLFNIRHAEYMTWPRAFAISESLWSPKAKKNWASFAKRVERQFPLLDLAEVKYAPSMYDPEIKVGYNADSTLHVSFSKELDDLDLYYSVDNSFPDNFYPKYSGMFSLPKDVAMLRVISYRNGKPIGRLITIKLEDLKKRAK